VCSSDLEVAETDWAIAAKDSPIKRDLILTIAIVFLAYFSGD